MTAPHPLASYDWKHTGAALGAAGILTAISYSYPAPLTHDLSALGWGYCGAVLTLGPARRSSQPRMVAIAILLALVIGALAGQAAWRWQQDGAVFLFPHAREVVLSLALAATLLPVLVPRWLAWREHQSLARQAAAHARERVLLEARLAALQGQIEPHFLFNTLSNVLYLLRHDGALAERMLDHLLVYLRGTLTELRQLEAPLEQELTRVKAYLDIMGLRMGERLAYRIDCPEDLHAMAIPPLSLATLVENAIRHGLEPKPGRGTVTISAGRTEDGIRVAVEDDGVGFSETGGAGGIGLKNLRERLALFGDRAGLTLEPGAQNGVRAVITLPARECRPA
jgi:signal transduction histidine kinase